MLCVPGAIETEREIARSVGDTNVASIAALLNTSL